MPIAMLAISSPAGNPSISAPMPKSAPMEDSASERWCQASAMKALELSTRAWWRVYQNIASLTMIESTAAARASMLGLDACRYDRVAMASSPT